ncbi:MAG TPA: DUF4126 family protein [Acidobacteriaceae bacterium]|nr:DUF4126 family protein [Acidobacteriaceae bacterium]
MTVLLLGFLLGCVTGLRSLTGPAVVCWGAHLGWLHLAGTRLAFLGRPTTVAIATLLALAELVADKLPKTPARTAPAGLSARILFGALVGSALAISAGRSPMGAAIAGLLGGVAGAFAGYTIRHSLVTQAHLPDLVVALAEDLVAIGGGLLIVSHL